MLFPRSCVAENIKIVKTDDHIPFYITSRAKLKGIREMDFVLNMSGKNFRFFSFRIMSFIAFNVFA
jgi:hypothetical protein